MNPILEAMEIKAKALKWALLAGFALFVVALGLHFRGRILQAERDQAASAVMVHKAETAKAKEEAQANARQLAAVEAEAARAKQDAEAWRAKYEAAAGRIPPKPPAPPESDPELARQLTAAGLSEGLKVIPEGITALAHPDAQKALFWAGEAARVPALEEAVATAGPTIQAQAQAIAKLDEETAAGKRLIFSERQLSGTKDQTIADLGKQVAAAEKQVRVEKWKKWIFTAAAAAIAFKAGQH